MELLLDDPQNRNLTIYFEFWPQGLIDAGSEPYELLSFLTRRGFTLMQVANNMTSPIGDVLTFVKNARVGDYVNLFAVRIARNQKDRS